MPKRQLLGDFLLVKVLLGGVFICLLICSFIHLFTHNKNLLCSYQVPCSKLVARDSSMFTIIPDLKSSEADSITVSNYNKMKPVVMTKEAQGKVESYSGLRVREVLSSM